jgi:hypothetical protein
MKRLPTRYLLLPVRLYERRYTDRSVVVCIVLSRRRVRTYKLDCLRASS